MYTILKVTDPHHEYCSICGMGGNNDLLECLSCPQAFHTWCVKEPHLTSCTPPDSWFCPVCIERGWNELDSTQLGFETSQVQLDIEESPSTTSNEVQGAINVIVSTGNASGKGNVPVATSDHFSGNNMASSIEHAESSHQRTLDGSPALSDHPSYHHDETRHENENLRQFPSNVDEPSDQSRQNVSSNQTSPQSLSNSKTELAKSSTRKQTTPEAASKPKRASKPGQHTFALSQGTFFVGSQKNSSLDPGLTQPNPSSTSKPHSRFSNLSVHINQAASTLIEELESTAALKVLVSQLEEKVSTLQNLQIQAGREALAGTDTRALREENKVLKAEVVVLRGLKARNGVLEKMVKDLQEEKERKESEMAALKEKVMSVLQT